jgi:divinyl protochlorophyllide a 8-vinyl-reductase
MVGPNAVIQVAHVLTAMEGEALTARVFRTAGLGDLYLHLPRQMVPQETAARLHQAVRIELPATLAVQVAKEAGSRTADYLLTYRIPRPVQWLLRLLPAGPSARLLLKAIAANAWTFAGTGRLSWTSSRHGAVIEIKDNPLAMHPCTWHVAVFETLFSRLVARQAEVHETACTGARSNCALTVPSKHQQFDHNQRSGAQLRFHGNETRSGDGLCRFEVWWGQ